MSDERVEAGAKALVEWLGQSWDGYSEEDRENARESVRVVLAAAPQPPPSVPAEDTAAVLAGLVEEIGRAIEEASAERAGSHWDRATGLRQAWYMVDKARQAATGARAVGNPWTAQSEALLPYVDDVDDEPSNVLSDMLLGYNPTPGEEPRFDQLSLTHARRSARAWWNAAQEAAAAPPAPCAHGVAELLAECRERIENKAFGFRAVMDCDEIVRLLAPGGADGGQS